MTARLSAKQRELLIAAFKAPDHVFNLRSIAEPGSLIVLHTISIGSQSFPTDGDATEGGRYRLALFHLAELKYATAPTLVRPGVFQWSLTTAGREVAEKLLGGEN